MPELLAVTRVQPPLRRRAFPSLVATAGLFGVLCAASVGAEPEFSAPQIEFFEKHIRPLLVERCHKCHAVDEPKGGLRLDSRAALLDGGDTGPAIVPGNPDESELIHAVRYEPDGDQMPPDGKLPQEAIDHLTAWVAMGAPWPDAAPSRDETPAATPKPFDFDERAAHWSFQPLVRPPIPPVEDAAWCRTPVDRFLLARLEEHGVAPAPEADRSTWLRRVCFDVIGLPPTPGEVRAFVNDRSPDAYAKVIERLLSSPHFGERWGRHWLDLVRYAESRGHEFDHDVANPWHYRDYVIRALNDDVPYDQFVVEHVAGDLLVSAHEHQQEPDIVRDDHSRSTVNRHSGLMDSFEQRGDYPLRLHSQTGGNESILATGFWFLGEWVHSPVDIRQDEADRFENMIDVYSKTFLGLTVACARCHDHKFDPITQKDYYALQGYLQSSIYRQVRFETMEHNRRVAANRSDSASFAYVTDRPTPDRSPGFVAETDFQAEDLEPEPATLWLKGHISSLNAVGVNEVALPQSMPSTAGWWEPRQEVFHLQTTDFVPEPGATDSFLPGVRLRTPTFEIASGQLHCLIRGGIDLYVAVDSHILIRGPLHGSLVQKHRGRHNNTPWRWVTLDVSRYRGHRAHLEFAPRADENSAIARVIQSRDAPPTPDLPRLPDQPPDDALPSSEVAVRLSSAVAPAMRDGTGEDEYVFIRGNWKKPGEVVPRRFLEVFGGRRMPRPDEGSGRLELARWMVDPDRTPILPRVIVNRIWQHYFGTGIVSTPDDFGHMGRPPSHSELLDWLASELVDSGWSLKHIHLLILNSAAYRMASEAKGGRGRAESGYESQTTNLQSEGSESNLESQPTTLNPDPSTTDSQLFALMPVKRLEGEIIRDAMLALSGRLDDRMYGRSVPVHLTPFMEGRGRPAQSGPVDGAGRRSLYIAVRRNFPDPFFQAFDMPNPHTTTGRRTVSNVPAQALALMNNPMVVEQSQRWAARMLSEAPDADAAVRIRAACRAAFSREPTDNELAVALAFLETQAQELNATPDDPRIWADLCHVLFNAKEFVFVR